MLKAYIDGSGNGSPDSLVLAGYIASDEQWANFSAEWQEMLDKLSMTDFKMSRMAQSSERMEQAAWFYRIIEKHTICSVSSIINTAKLRNTLDDAIKKNALPVSEKNIKHLKNPYFMAFRTLIYALLHKQKSIGISEPITLVFDKESEQERAIIAWCNLKEKSTPEIQALMGSAPLYEDDKKVLPLQAADLFAWWVRKWEKQGINWTDKFDFPWKTNSNFTGLHVGLPEEEFINGLAMRLYQMSGGLSSSWFGQMSDPSHQLLIHGRIQ